MSLLNVVWKESKATGLDKFVLAFLVHSSNSDGYCWPSVGAICRACSLSEATVRRAIKTLTELGELRIVERFGEIDGRQLSNVYQTLPPCHTDTLPLPQLTPSHILDTNLNSELPPYPQRGNGAVVAKATKKKRLGPEILDSLEVELFLRSDGSFVSAWRRWFDHKVGRLGNKLTLQALQLDLKRLHAYPNSFEAVEAIDFAIQACWMAIGKYRPKPQSPAAKKESKWGCL